MKSTLEALEGNKVKLSIEVDESEFDSNIDAAFRKIAHEVRLPGFRPGKVRASVVRQRFRDEITHDVMHELVPRAVEQALNERGIEPVGTPSVKEVSLKEGTPLTFQAAVETIPEFDPGDLSTVNATRPVELVVLDGTTPLARTSIALAGLR